MSNYIIAGEAGSQDLADCEFLGSKLVASTPSTSIHIIAKHHTEWDEFLKKTCSGYGFKEPSNPIIFTVEGKLIGDKSSFKQHVLESYSVRGELDKNLRGLISEYDKVSLENFRQKEADGPTVIETIRDRIDEIVKSGGMRIADGFFQECIDNAFEFSVKISQILGPFTYDSFDIWGENLDFIPVAELASEKAEEDVLSNRELKVTEEDFAENEEDSKNGDFLSESGKPKELEKPPVLESPLITNEESDPDFSLRNYEVDDKNIKKFIELFTKANFVDNTEAQAEVTEIPVPTSIKTLKIFKSNIVKDLPRDYTLALSPFPLIPRELIVFSGKMVEGGWLLRDCSMMQNWLKVINIPPQRPVYKDGDILDPIIPKEPVFVKDISGSCLKYRGYTTQQLSLDLECSRNSSLKLNTINIMIRHILTECDWEIWYKTIKELNAIGYYQLLPYGETK